METTVRSADGSDASLIDWSERDHALNLHDESNWGGTLSAQWEEIEKPGRHFTRPLLVSNASDKKAPDIAIEESIVRFPSVPIYGINRKANYNLEFSEKPNMHTLRVLTKAVGDDDRKAITRTFILHNGLNETSNLHFYYRLASWIFREDEDCEHNSACVIAPFPGHLMHAPFSGPFGQTPLARYLADSGDLFRQFLRYMIEMRWLLSMIVRDQPEPWRVGGSTLEPTGQAGQIEEEMTNLRNASRKVWKGRRPFGGSLGEEGERKLLGAEISDTTVQSTIDVMTHLLGLEGPGERAAVPVHVVGYSLGGFLAQSVFFAWPNIVSSCSTICSGGAIRALSPTAFAHAEEWQAVLHALRPELEDSMIGMRIVRDLTSHQIVGMGEAQFGYYQRIFDQVFLQEDNASYKARLSEYGTRMLFVSGGEDPIVKTKEVLDAGPDDGITMLSVANLTHFLGESARSERETEQREFWLPEAGGLIARAAQRAEVLQLHELEDARREHEQARELERELEDLRAKGAEDSSDELEEEELWKSKERDLANPGFETALDWVIRGVRHSPKGVSRAGLGWLFIFRNGIPAAFLDPAMQRAWATGLHHHDVSVQKYAVGLARRALALQEIESRTTLVLPPGLKRTFVESSSGLVDPHSDAPGYLTTDEQRNKAWNLFLDRWDGKARRLEPGSIGEPLLGGTNAGPCLDFAKAAADWQGVPAEHLYVTHLPDVWISLGSRSFREGVPDEAIGTLIDYVKGILKHEPSVLERPTGKAKSKAGKDLELHLNEGLVRIVRVSGAELNPRYRGRVEEGFRQALPVLAHCVAALTRSTTETLTKDEDDERKGSEGGGQ